MYRLSSNTAYRASCWAPLNEQVQQVLTQSVSDSAVKRAVVSSESAVKKTVSHTDITVLIATKSDDKDWQTVLKKATRF
jgi:hypothetical protein